MPLDIVSSIDGKWNGTDNSGRLVARDYADGGNDAKVIVKKHFSNIIPSSAVTNTTTETLFDQYYTVPANLLQPGSVIRIRYQGIVSAAAAGNFNSKLYIGGLAGTGLQTETATAAVANQIFAGQMELTIRTIGAAGTFVGSGWFNAVPAASGTATLVINSLASTAINTTVAQVIGVSALWSAANAGNSARLDQFDVEIF